MQNLSEFDASPLSLDGLRNRVQNYYEYAYSKSGEGSKVFMSTVIPRNVLEEMLNTTDETGGIRIYLTKDDPEDTQDNVRLLAVAVRPESEEQSRDLLQADSKMYLTSCRDPYCPKIFAPDHNLLPAALFS